MSFPTERPRRLRTTPALRRLARETALAPQDLIYPLFVREGIQAPAPIEAMPGQLQHTLESVIGEVEDALKLGIQTFLFFGVPASKDATGSGAWQGDGIVQRAIARIRETFGQGPVLAADLCLCEYTDHGHCGVLREQRVDNDETVAIYQ